MRNLEGHHSQRAPGPCAKGRKREKASEKHWSAVQCCKRPPLPEGITDSHNPILPCLQPHRGPSATSFQEPIHAQPASPCPSNTGGVLVPSSTTALPLPGPDPNPWTDLPARPWTCLVVPRLCPTLLPSPDPITTSDLPHHHQLPRGSRLWADTSCSPRAHRAHLAWRW